MKLIRQIIRLFLFILVTIIIVPAQMIWALFPVADKYKFARVWHRWSLRTVGVHALQIGTPEQGKVLFLANHICHLDIPAIGGFTTVRFISKKEVRQWPVFGFLATIQDTLFIDRSPSRAGIQSTRAAIQSALDNGDRLVIFPEGTNTLGDKVLPFRRGVLDGLTAAGYKIQPVAIKCTGVDGHAVITRDDIEAYGWGDVSFALHLWRVMGHKRIDVSVHFLPAYNVDETGKIDAASIEQSGHDVRQIVEAA